jgi:hypothetical protein
LMFWADYNTAAPTECGLQRACFIAAMTGDV